MSKYGIISGRYFPVFSPNTGKYRPEINTVFGHFLRSENLASLEYFQWIVLMYVNVEGFSQEW